MHRHSPRAAGPFVAVNMAALSPNLAEAELFGHVEGAFTGATQMRRGLLAQANGGTLFIDEVAEIPLNIQVKLLRALDQGEVLPVGADKPVIFSPFGLGVLDLAVGLEVHRVAAGSGRVTAIADFFGETERW